jgi:PAS domain S-box-containing protein
VGEDMAQSKQEKEALKEGEASFRDLFVNAADAIFIADLDTGIVVDANHAAARLMRLPLDHIIGLHQSKLHPEQKDEYSKESFAKHKTMAGQMVPTNPVENTVLRSDGVEVPVEVLASMVTVKGKKCLMGTFRDITERKLRDDQLERDHKLLELIAKTDLTFI